MNIFITGGTGFIGRKLSSSLLARGHKITILSRSAARPGEGIRVVTGDPTRQGPWQEVASEHDIVINLAGASVFCRWTRTNKERIYSSRINTTRNIVDALSPALSKVRLLINGSAVGFYGDRKDESLTESTGAGDDFLARVASDWEREAMRAADIPLRVACCRIGVVLGPGGGAITRMLPPFRLGLGSRIGSGKQWFPWIHLDDLVNIYNLIIEDSTIAGPVNCTAPEPATNADLTRALARSLGRPLLMPPVPAFLLRLAMGEASNLLLDSQKVEPALLTDKGFQFKFPGLDAALKDILS